MVVMSCQEMDYLTLKEVFPTAIFNERNLAYFVDKVRTRPGQEFRLVRSECGKDDFELWQEWKMAVDWCMGR